MKHPAPDRIEPGAEIVVSVQVGRAAPLGPEGVLSGFVKSPVSGFVEVTPIGITGDEQADLRVHGGPDKAAYGYAKSRYAAWQATHPQWGKRRRRTF